MNQNFNNEQNINKVQNQQEQNIQNQQAQIVKEKKKSEEFTLQWYIKVLAIIYVVLGILYVFLRIFLK